MGNECAYKGFGKVILVADPETSERDGANRQQISTAMIFSTSDSSNSMNQMCYCCQKLEIWQKRPTSASFHSLSQSDCQERGGKRPRGGKRQNSASFAPRPLIRSHVIGF